MKTTKVKALENKLKSKVAELTNDALRDMAEKLNVTPFAEFCKRAEDSLAMSRKLVACEPYVVTLPNGEKRTYTMREETDAELRARAY